MPDPTNAPDPDPSHLHRRDDMDTSVGAAEFIANLTSIFRKRVWEYALERGEEGFTDRECADAMAHRLGSNAPQRSSTYRSRRNELTIMGAIVDTGRRKTHPPSNRKHAVWKAVRMGESS